MRVYSQKCNAFGSPWVARSVEHQTFGFGAGHDLGFLGVSPTLASWLSTESA